MSTTNSNNKRKADGISGVSSHATGGSASKLIKTAKVVSNHHADDRLRHLPAPVWGHVLDYLRYEEVRNTLQVCILIAKEAVKYVRTLSVFHSAELYIPAALKFSCVSVVNVFALLNVGVVEREHHAYLDVEIKEAVMWKVIPFLSSFTKLKRTALGGYLEGIYYRHKLNRRESLVVYEEPDGPLCSGPKNHRILFLAFIDSFLGAIKSGLLSANLTSAKGLINAYDEVFSNSCDDSLRRSMGCHRCRDICKYLPFTDVWESDLCLRQEEFFEILKERDGGSSFMKSKSEKALLKILQPAVQLFSYEEDDDDWCEKMPDPGMCFLHDVTFTYLDEKIRFGFCPAAIPKESVSECLLKYARSRDDPIDWAESSLTKLKERGFDTSDLERRGGVFNDGGAHLKI